MQSLSLIKSIHSLVAYFFIFSAITSVAYALSMYFKKNAYSPKQLLITRFAFISSHIQLVLGFILWWLHGFPQMMSEDMKGVMRDSHTRLLAIEHPMTNVIAITILTIGFISIKKTSSDESKQIKNIIFFGIALLLILSRIPYSSWLKM